MPLGKQSDIFKATFHYWNFITLQLFCLQGPSQYKIKIQKVRCSCCCSRARRITNLTVVTAAGPLARHTVPVPCSCCCSRVPRWANTGPLGAACSGSVCSHPHLGWSSYGGGSTVHSIHMIRIKKTSTNI